MGEGRDCWDSWDLWWRISAAENSQISLLEWMNGPPQAKEKNVFEGNYHWAKAFWTIKSPRVIRIWACGEGRDGEGRDIREIPTFKVG